MDLLANMPSGFAAVFWGVITFSLLVIIHEGGHFLAARAFGVKVHEFMIGLPGPALSFRSRRSGVRYGITMLPLGGYVRIAGMEPGEEDALLGPALGAIRDWSPMRADTLARELTVDISRATSLLTTLADWGVIEPQSDGEAYSPTVELPEGATATELLDAARSVTYRGRKTWQRVIILVSGVVFNLLAAMLIFTVTLSVWGYDGVSLKLDEVAAGGPALAAGVRVGDVVAAFDGRSVTEWPQLIDLLSKARVGDRVILTVRRKGATLRIPVVLGVKEDGTSPLLGVRASVEHKSFTVFTAARESVIWTGLVFQAVGDFFNPGKFADTVKNSRSVVGISYEVAQAAKKGPINYAWMFALLSLSLGVLNILPIPPLDGGKVVVELFERLRNRPLRREISYGFSAVGAVLLFSLIFYLMYADVMRYIVKG